MNGRESYSRALEQGCLPEPVPARGLDADDVAVVEVGQPGRPDRVGRQRAPRLPEHPLEVRVVCWSLG